MLTQIPSGSSRGITSEIKHQLGILKRLKKKDNELTAFERKKIILKWQRKLRQKDSF